MAHVAGSIVVLAGCDWMRAHSCERNASKCSGDRVQVCVPDLEATIDAREELNRWTTEKTCADDPQLGKYTCGIVAGRATCVPEVQEDAAADTDAGNSTEGGAWIRVRVTQDADAGLTLAEAERTSVPASDAPSDPAWGPVAVVSSRAGTIIDATLVPIAPDQADAYAWVADDQADEIRLLDADGRVLSTTSSIGASPVSAERFAVPTRRTTNVVARLGRTQVQLQPRMLELLDQALVRVPGQLMLLAPRVVLELDSSTARTLATSAAVDDPHVTEELPADFFTSRARSVRARWFSRRQELIVDLSSEALAEYETSTLALSSDIVRALAETYVYFTTVVGDLAASPTAEIFKKPPSDFPPELAPLLYNHYAQLLASGESPVSAWHALHRVAAVVQLAEPYVEDLGSFPRSEGDAVRAGFASHEGASGPEEDLTDYVARAAVPESWAFGPCSAMRGVPLDMLAPPLLVHASKLVALYGLGLLQQEALAACIGELRVGAVDRGGAFVVHESDGDRITFTDELEGIRQPYFSDEVQLSWKAQRAYLSASLSVGYRGTRPNVMRLQAVAGHEGRDFRSGADYGAVLAFTNPDGYRTSVAAGGLVVVTDVRPDALNAFSLMTVLEQPIAGGKVFPLISAQVAAPTWGDAP